MSTVVPAPPAAARQSKQDAGIQLLLDRDAMK
jgi:hypothetical protein